MSEVECKNGDFLYHPLPHPLSPPAITRAFSHPPRHAIMSIRKDVIVLQKEFTTNKSTFVFELPHICPNCSTGILPIIPNALENTSLIPYQEENNIYFILQCPSCQTIFFAVYEYSRFNTPPTLVATYPHSKKVSLPDEVKNMFPDFFELYTQASIAEQSNLSRIIGMAYRKALEMLVKQYLIQEIPECEDAILNEPLGHSISRISSKKIQNLARAISWIGNDQTHMIQKHPDYNVPEMKRFILALCHLIVSEYVANEAYDFITS